MIRLLVAFALVLALAGVNLALSFVHGFAGYAWVSLSLALLETMVLVFVFMDFSKAKASARLAFFTGIAFIALFIGMTVAEKLTRAPPPLLPPPASP